MIPNIWMALGLMLFGVGFGLLIMRAFAIHIEHLICVILLLLFGRWITDEPLIKALMQCGYLTIVLMNVMAFFGLMVYEILF